MTMNESNLAELISEQAIQDIVATLARQIALDYQSEIHLLCILEGARVFHDDLKDALISLGKKVITQEITLQSYEGTCSTGTVSISGTLDIRGKDILIIEDIVDTGRSMHQLQKYLKHHGVRTARICAMLSKPSRRINHVEIPYLGKEIEDIFVVGYGMDHDGKYRNLPAIYEFLPD